MKVFLSASQIIFQIVRMLRRIPHTHLSISGTERNKLSRTQDWVSDIPYGVACRNHLKAMDWILIMWLSAILLLL